MMKRNYGGVILLALLLLPAVLSAQEVSLTVISGSGERGTAGNQMAMTLTNAITISWIYVDLQFDETVLGVTEVEAGPRIDSTSGATLSWSNISPGKVRLAAMFLAEQPLGPGTGTLAELSVQVADDAPVGITPVDISLVLVRRYPDSQQVPASWVNGAFDVFVLPHLGLSQTGHDFGGVLVGAAGQWNLSVFNAGTDRLTVANITMTGPEFKLALPAFPQILGPDSGFDVTVTFVPKATGRVAGLLKIYSDDADSSVYSLRVAGEGMVPDIAVSAGNHDFGQVPVGTSAQWTLVVSNEGQWPLEVQSAVFSAVAGFSAVSPTFPVTIPGGGQQDVIIGFAPASDGSAAAQLTLTSSDPDERSLKVSLSGTGVKVPDISVSAQQHDFGKVLAGSSQNWTMTISNQGTGPLTVSRVTFSDNSYKLSSPSFPQTIQPGSQISPVVLFAPTRQGQIPCQMTIESNDPDEASVSVSLSGEGLVPNISLSATSNDFGGVLIGTTKSWELTISNTGTGLLKVNSVVSSHADFSVQSPTFPQDIAAGANLRVAVVFAPKGSGPVSATLTVSSSDPDQGTARVNLNGTALVPDIDLAVAEYDFGGVFIDSVSVWSLVVTNPGSGTLTVEEVSVDHADLAVVWPSFPQTVGASQSLEIRIEYVPSSQDSVQAILTLRSNDPDEGTTTVVIHGYGLPPVTLAVGQSVGEPGAMGLSIPIEMENVLPVAQMQFAVQYDSTLLTITGVDRTARVAQMGAFGWSRVNGGQILVYISDFSGQQISAGSGPVAMLSVAVAELAPPRAILLSLTGSAFFSPQGFEYESRVINGLFTVIVGDISLTETEMDFGQVGVGVSSGLQLTILNPGTQELVLDSLVSDHPDIWVSYPSFPQSVPPSGNVEATIVCRPTAVGIILGHLRIYSNDPDEGVISIPFHAEGVAAAVLVVGDGSGEAGSSGRRVDIMLHNSRDVYGLQFVLNFDGARLMVTGIQATARTESLDVFDWTVLEQNQVLCVMSGLEGTPIAPGDGAVAEVVLSVAPDAPGGDQVLWLSGLHAFDYSGEEIITAGLGGVFNIGGADVAVGAVNHDFGMVTLGDSAWWSMSVRNVGTYPLGLQAITSSHPDFAVTGLTWPVTIAAHDSLMVTVIYSPASSGAASAEMVIQSSDPDEPSVLISLIGNGVVPDIASPVGGHDFGLVGVGNSLDWLMTVTNQGQGLLKISGITLGRPQFQVTWPTRFPQTIVPGGSMGIVVAFSPDALGKVSTVMEVMSNDPDEQPLTVSLSGEGGALSPDIHLSSAGHDFGDVVVGHSADWTFTITNTGVADLHLESIAADTTLFSVISPRFPQTLQPQGRISVVVLFSPTAAGNAGGLLTVHSDDPDEASVALPVSGRGVTAAVAEIAISSALHHFGSVPVGQSSQWECLISNAGTADLTVQSIVSSEAVFSVVSPPFPQTLSPSFQVPVLVRFAPLALGPREGILTVLSTDPDEDSLLVQLSGIGISGTLNPRIDVSAGGYNFGAVEVGQQATWVFTLSNTGQTALLIHSILSDHSDFRVMSPAFPQTVLPGQSLSAETVFAPLSEGLKAGALAVQSTDPDHPMVYVFLSGTGQHMVGVELCRFQAINTAQGVLLTWTTAERPDEARFYISRKGEHEAQFELLTEEAVTGRNPCHYLDALIEQPGLYQYQLAMAGRGGERQLLSSTWLEVKPASIGRCLSQNYPNPFNPSTNIAYSVPSGGWVELAIYNVLGQKVTTLLSQYQTKGHYAVTWDGLEAGGRPVNSGIYVAQLTVGERVEHKKMMLLR